MGHRNIAGVDEVGRGPLAGPVVAGAVLLPPGRRPAWLAQLRDSKRLCLADRAALAPRLRAYARAWALGWAGVEEIDRLGIGEATRLAARRAVAALPLAPDFILLDGNDHRTFSGADQPPHLTVVGGDARVAAIAAASVVAKVARDAWMVALHAEYPAYGFHHHVGYGTPEHQAALAACGPCPQHRRSFAPVLAALGRQGLAPCQPTLLP